MARTIPGRTTPDSGPGLRSSSEFFWILIFAAIAFIVSMVVRRGWHRQMASADPSGHDRARAILAERFARGEISAEEYDERVSHLTS